MHTRIIASFLIGALIAGGAVYPATAPPSPEGPVILAGVPDVRQAEHYSCGASSPAPDGA
ncbi:MAG: hypothetical protein PWR16_1768 [Methanoculleus sp.]|nr:hypothetical protein [Methanoculleus sp.]